MISNEFFASGLADSDLSSYAGCRLNIPLGLKPANAD
jgi:hypothetical protein